MRGDSDVHQPTASAQVEDPRWGSEVGLGHHLLVESRKCILAHRFHLCSDGDTPDSARVRVGHNVDTHPTAQSCAHSEHPQVLDEALLLQLLLLCYLDIYAWLNRPLLDPELSWRSALLAVSFIASRSSFRTTVRG